MLASTVVTFSLPFVELLFCFLYQLAVYDIMYRYLQNIVWKDSFCHTKTPVVQGHDILVYSVLNCSLCFIIIRTIYFLSW